MSNNNQPTEVIDKDFMIEEEKNILKRNEYFNDEPRPKVTAELRKQPYDFEQPSTKSTSSRLEEGHKLYVCNITRMRHHDELYDLFSKYGKISQCNVVIDPITKNSRGYGFVTMQNIEDAELAIKELDGTQVQGRIINIQFARVKSPHRTDKENYRKEETYRRNSEYSNRANLDNGYNKYRDSNKNDYYTQEEKRHRNTDHDRYDNSRHSYSRHEEKPKPYNHYQENSKRYEDDRNDNRYKRHAGYEKEQPYDKGNYQGRTHQDRYESERYSKNIRENESSSYSNNNRPHNFLDNNSSGRPYYHRNTPSLSYRNHHSEHLPPRYHDKQREYYKHDRPRESDKHYAKETEIRPYRTNRYNIEGFNLNKTNENHFDSKFGTNVSNNEDRHLAKKYDSHGRFKPY